MGLYSIVFFDCRDSAKLPWNTTKTGLDSSNAIWLATYQKMLDHTRAVMRFLNLLDDDIEEFGRTSSPLLTALTKETVPREVEKYQGQTSFSWNKRPKAPGPKRTRIQYTREEEKIKKLMTALGVGSAKSVGEATFDAIFNEQVEDDE